MCCCKVVEIREGLCIFLEEDFTELFTTDFLSIPHWFVQKSKSELFDLFYIVDYEIQQSNFHLTENQIFSFFNHKKVISYFYLT
jgi:hypothetical protein